MFSGLIQQIGVVASHSRNHLSVQIPSGVKIKLGDSLAINGVCLTVMRQLKISKAVTLFFDVSQETLAKTTLGSLFPRTKVNIERALSPKDLLGGHIVQGHVDGVGRVDKIIRQKDGIVMYISAPKEILRCIVSKGSVTVDGVSLTTVQVTKKTFSVTLIPFTLTRTTLSNLQKGDHVNLEADIIAKYVMQSLRGAKRRTDPIIQIIAGTYLQVRSNLKRIDPLEIAAAIRRPRNDR